MVKVSVLVTGACGLTLALWKRLVATIDEAGFAGLYLDDHFSFSPPLEHDSFDPIVALAYAADHTQNVEIGSMVAPLSVRDPVMLARQAIALDYLSDGRMVLGVGAGWHDEEHRRFGYELGDIPVRMARLKEGLEVITSLLRQDEPVSFEGRFFSLHDAELLPGPRSVGHPPILVGGSGTRYTLPLVASFADRWNAQNVSPEDFASRSARLDELLTVTGRSTTSVARSVMSSVVCARDNAEVARRAVGPCIVAPELSAVPPERFIESFRAMFPSLVAGTPEDVIAGIRAYEAAGANEFVIQWWGVDDVEGLEVIARDVLPALATA